MVRFTKGLMSFGFRPLCVCWTGTRLTRHVSEAFETLLDLWNLSEMSQDETWLPRSGTGVEAAGGSGGSQWYVVLLLCLIALSFRDQALGTSWSIKARRDWLTNVVTARSESGGSKHHNSSFDVFQTSSLHSICNQTT